MLNDTGAKVAVALALSALVYYVGSKKSKTISLKPLRKASVAQGQESGFGPKDSVTVRVPATTANMGPGFDCIGMAVDIWNELTVERADAFSLTNEGEGSDVLPTDETNLVVVGLKAAFSAAGQDMPLLRIHCRNRIPFARGLGSSSAGIVAGIIAGLVIAGHELSVRGKEELLQLAANIEGHPDNVAPCIYGGLQLGIFTDDRWYSSRVQFPSTMQCVLFIPETTGKTSVARSILPKKIDRADAVFNIGRSALLVNALRNGNFKELRHATQDKLHQPQRGAEQYPHLFPLVDAALEAGAHACFLSGAGPTVLAICSGKSGDIFTQVAAERDETKVADAMREAAAKVGVHGCVFITNPEHRGAHIVRVSPKISDHLVARYEGDITDL
ncbi:homoserine kinase [Aphanomyces invadans]|uniref:Homoserine kinase n=1 Tax=Aphanomyces invadans TaxID=157072 RepID=A0A024UBF5_9STRA|nr:homoserine kinase [Aphanomyces invadans]ETW03746.1 homoserine kinase [Aphanomyces invadans]|eukprot:XP_008867975.1 homoserine kinase [Aphanomyces invadans]